MVAWFDHFSNKHIDEKEPWTIEDIQAEHALQINQNPMQEFLAHIKHCNNISMAGIGVGYLSWSPAHSGPGY